MEAPVARAPHVVPRETVSCCGVCGATERAVFDASSDVVECQGCGVLYVSPRPTAEAIGAFYSAAGHYAHWDDEPGRAAMWQRRTDRVRKLSPRGGRLLDVGTGQGDFGAAARKYFDFEGTEISSEGARLARERHGLRVHEGELLALDLPRGAYDAITLWHVLEHLADPRATIARCAELLKPGGVVCVAVPNTDEELVLRKAMLRAARDFALKQRPDRSIRFPRITLDGRTEEIHLTHFTLRTLTWLLRSLGLEVVERGIDDFSPELGLRARLRHHELALKFAWTGLASAPCIFAAARKPHG